jgi:lysyl-tRNA synthetase class 2
MAEWYRIGFNFEQMIQETLDFIRLFLGKLEIKVMTYRQMLQHFLGVDYTTASPADLLRCAKDHNVDLPQDAEAWDKDTLLQLLVGFLIEPHLGNNELFVLKYFPASQAALSKTLTLESGEPVACTLDRFQPSATKCRQRCSEDR